LAVWTKNKKDALGGLIIAAFGVVGLAEGLRLGSGTLRNMGPGYVPTALGFILMALVALACLGVLHALHGPGEVASPSPAETRLTQR